MDPYKVESLIVSSLSGFYHTSEREVKKKAVREKSKRR